MMQQFPILYPVSQTENTTSATVVPKYESQAQYYMQYRPAPASLVAAPSSFSPLPALNTSGSFSPETPKSKPVSTLVVNQPSAGQFSGDVTVAKPVPEAQTITGKKRAADSEGGDTVQSSGQSDPLENQVSKEDRRRERNKVAARTCRQTKKAYLTKLETENQRLRLHVDKLQEEIRYWQAQALLAEGERDSMRKNIAVQALLEVPEAVHRTVVK